MRPSYDMQPSVKYLCRYNYVTCVTFRQELDGLRKDMQRDNDGLRKDMQRDNDDLRQHIGDMKRDHDGETLQLKNKMVSMEEDVQVET